MKIVISGIGWVTAEGSGMGRSRESFGLTGGSLPTLRRRDVFTDPYQRFGRLDDFSKTGLAAIAFALRDAGRENWEQKRDVGIVAGTEFGCLPTDVEYYHTVMPQDGLLASPNLFAYTLPNSFLGEAALRFGLTGPGYVINESLLSSLTPLRLALETLLWGETGAVLAGVCNASPPEVLGLPRQIPAGAVFVLLEPAAEGVAGADVGTDGERLTCCGRHVHDWETLVNCIRGATEYSRSGASSS